MKRAKAKAKSKRTKRRVVISPQGNELTPWEPGNPGRPPGARNRVTSVIREAGLLAAELAGIYLLKQDMKLPVSRRHLDPNAGPLVNYLTHIALAEPRSMMSLLGKMLPLNIKASQDREPDDGQYKSIEEIDKALRDRGIDPRLLDLTATEVSVTEADDDEE